MAKKITRAIDRGSGRFPTRGGLFGAVVVEEKPRFPGMKKKKKDGYY